MNICQIIRDNEENYTTGYTNQGKYVKRSMYEVLQKIEAYLFSTHIMGRTDSLNREKPFFNIVSAASNIWYRATDLDRKDIVILPTESQQTALTFAGTALLQDWMNKEKFGHFLNDWGRSLARYGSSVVKFVKKEGRLIPSVITWNNLIVDQTDFYANPVIEKFYVTPAQLRQNFNYDQEAVEDLISAVQVRENLEGTNVDNKSGFIEIYEIHGNLPLSCLDDNENHDTIYRQQMHIVSFLLNKDGEYDEYTLYKGKEEKSPYMITHLIEEPGMTLSVGAVEYLFDAQWMVNHTAKQMKDYLDLASKLIFQTADSNFVGRNILSNIETGAILRHAPNMPLTQVNNTVGNIVALQNFGQMWKQLAQDITSTPDAYRGNTLPSGTPYSLGAILQQQAGSLFELMTENKGLYLEDMMREFVIPFIKTKMDTSDEIATILDEKGVTEIDSMYVPREAIKRYNKDAVDMIIKSKGQEVPSPYQADLAQSQVKQELSTLGNMRFLKPSEIPTKTWKSLLKDLEWKVKVVVTNEPVDKQAVLQTLSTVLQSIASNPAILQDPTAKMIFGKILQQTAVISPIELSTSSSAPVPLPTPLPASSGDGVPTPLSVRNINV